MRTCVILNPTAGGGNASESPLKSALESLPGAIVRSTPAPGTARRIAAQAVREGFERVVAAGGDGTLNEVIHGLAPDFAPEIGLIPLGTGNDLARTLEIPPEPSEAVALLRQGRTRRIDAVRFDGRGEEWGWFVNASAGGFSGEVDERLDREVKGSWGPLSYLRGAFEALSGLEPYAVWIRLDDGERLELDAVNVVVANGRTIAAGIPVAPSAAPDDGLLDLVAIRPAPVAGLSMLASKALVGSHLDDDLVLHRRSARIEVHAEPAMPFNVDGELTGETPVRYAVRPGALRFVAP